MFLVLKSGLIGLSLFALTAGAQSRNSSPTKPQTHSTPAPAAGTQSSPDSDRLATALKRKQEATEPADVADATKLYLVELLLRYSQVAVLEGQLDRATSVAERALALNGSADVRLRVAATLLRLSQPSQAIEVLQPGIEGDLAGSPQAYTMLAVAQRESGKQADAAQSFAQSLKLKPDINVAYALGSVLLQLHRDAEAKRLFDDIFTATQNDPLWHVAVGDAYREAGDYQQAVTQFKEAIARDPKALHGEFFLGLTYLQMNEWGPSPESFQHLRNAVAISPHEYLSNFYLGALESTDGSDLPSSDRHLHAACDADPNQPEAWLYLGMNANREHDSAAAEKYFRKSIELTGADESRNNYQVRRAYFALGRLLVTSGRREEGLQLLEKYKTAEQAASAADATTLHAMKGPADAPAALDPAMALQVSAAPELSERFQPRLTAEQQKALRDGKEALLRMLADGFNDLGTAEARMQQYDQALASFHEAESWQPPSPALLRNIGAAAFRVGNFAEAARALTLYLKTSKNADADAHAALMLGFSQFNQGHFDAAAEAFGSARSASMADDRAAYSWAFSLARTGKAQDANSIANELVARSLPTEILSLVCHLYVDSENYNGSLDCYRKVYAQDPGLLLAHFEAGQALVHLDRPQEAVVELQDEKKLQPDNPDVEYALDYALLQASKKDEAQQRLAALVSKHPEHAAAQYQLGKLLLDEGNVAEAVEHLEASERADDSADYVHYQLGAAYRRANRSGDAEREFKVYREMKDKKRASATLPPAAANQQP
jgi:tetratricopeptide (TPR) repeat protein